MAQNIVVILTEGDHDAAFLYRILKANGFVKYSKLIKDFPVPLNNLLATDGLMYRYLMKVFRMQEADFCQAI